MCLPRQRAHYSHHPGLSAASGKGTVSCLSHQGPLTPVGLQNLPETEDKHLLFLWVSWLALERTAVRSHSESLRALILILFRALVCSIWVLLRGQASFLWVPCGNPFQAIFHWNKGCQSLTTKYLPFELFVISQHCSAERVEQELG